MAEPTSSLTYVDFVNRLSLVKYRTRSPDSTQKAECQALVNDGYMRFLAEHEWTFMRPVASLTFWPTASGTAAVGATTTITDATNKPFLPTMIGKTITFTASGRTYTIASVTSTSVCVVTSTAADDAGTAFTITADGTYRLPDDFGGMIDPFVFTENVAAPMRLVERPAAYIRQLWAETVNVTTWPQLFAIEPVAFVAATGLRHQVIVWPQPASAVSAYYRYRVQPTRMTSDTEYPLGAARHSMTILDAILCENELQNGQAQGPFFPRYYGPGGRPQEGSLYKSIAADAALAPRQMGYYGDPGEYRGRYSRVDTTSGLSVS